MKSLRNEIVVDADALAEPIALLEEELGFVGGGGVGQTGTGNEISTRGVGISGTG